MSVSINGSGNGTTIARGTSAAEFTSDDKSVAGNENWFSDAAQRLYATKPGTALHYLTDFDERCCQRYAAGSVKPPAYFLRALLRSEHGWQWLSAAMDGSTAEWWRDLQRAQRIAEKLKDEF